MATLVPSHWPSVFSSSLENHPQAPPSTDDSHIRRHFSFSVSHYYLIHRFSTSITMRLLQLAVVGAALLLLVYAEDQSHQETHSVEKRSLLILPKFLLLKGLPLLKKLPLPLPLPFPLPIPVAVNIETRREQQSKW